MTTYRTDHHHAPTIERAHRERPTPGAAAKADRRSEEDFETFVQEHQGIAYAVAFRLLRSPEAAADATQEAWLRAYAAWDRFQAGNRRAWLLRIVTNVAFDELRRRKRRPQPTGEPVDFGRLRMPAHDEPPDGAVEHRELAEVLDKAMRGLRPEWRTTVALADLAGLSYSEVAETMGLPVGTVRSRLSRSRSALRHMLLAMDEADGYVPADARPVLAEV